MVSMADYTLSSRDCFQAYRSRKGAPQIRAFQESTAASTAVIAFGNVVQLDGGSTGDAHRIIRCSSGTGTAPLLLGGIVGVAAQGSTSDGSSSAQAAYDIRRQLSVWVQDADTEFKAPTRDVIRASMIGLGCEVNWDSTLNINLVSIASTSGDARFTITDILPATIGDTGGYVIGRFHSTAVSAVVQPR
jgi:hypothetical protein